MQATYANLHCSALGRKTDGTFMTAFGLQIYSNKIEAHANEEGEMTGTSANYRNAMQYNAVVFVLPQPVNILLPHAVSINGLPTESLLNETSNYEYTFRGENGAHITVEK